MQMTEPVAPRKSNREPCPKCGVAQFRRLERLFPDLLLSRQPCKCFNCFYETKTFRPGLVTVLELLIILVLCGGAYYLRNHPFALRAAETGISGDDAESLARARSAMGGGQLSAFEKMMTRRPRTTLSNKEVLQLWRAQVPVNIIVQMIRTSNPDFDVSAASVIELRKEGLEPSIMLAMIDASYTTR